MNPLSPVGAAQTFTEMTKTEKKMPFTQRPPFFLVWSPVTGYARKRHKTIQLAEKEAQRLADANPGQKFHVLLSLGRCTSDDKKSGE